VLGLAGHHDQPCRSCVMDIGVTPGVRLAALARAHHPPGVVDTHLVSGESPAPRVAVAAASCPWLSAIRVLVGGDPEKFRPCPSKGRRSKYRVVHREIRRGRGTRVAPPESHSAADVAIASSNRPPNTGLVPGPPPHPRMAGCLRVFLVPGPDGPVSRPGLSPVSKMQSCGCLRGGDRRVCRRGDRHRSQPTPSRYNRQAGFPAARCPKHRPRFQRGRKKSIFGISFAAPRYYSTTLLL